MKKLIAFQLTYPVEIMDQIINKLDLQDVLAENTKENRIHIFNAVRDIPYFANMNSISDPALFLNEINEHLRGSCTPKNYLLGELFKKLGLEVEFVSYPFHFSDCGINLPAQLEELAKDMPPFFHFGIKVFQDEKWILVDSTWDSALTRIGFPVNQDWNGCSETINAVRSEKEINHHQNFDDRISLVKQAVGEWSYSEKRKAVAFFTLLNHWLESERNLQKENSHAN